MSAREARWVTAALLVAMACGDDDGGTTDSGTSLDMAGVDARPADPDAANDARVDPDAAEPRDLGPADAGLEPCDRPGVDEEVRCGMCGARTRFCTVDGVWEYGPCTGERGLCIAGTRDTIACGRCGTVEARCSEQCVWEELGTCTAEHGSCDRWERTADGCPVGATRGCGPDCEWRDPTECAAPPSDLDGDGAPYETDCDDADPAIRPGTTVPCGQFVCGPTTMELREGTRRCIGPGWGPCERPPRCVEPTGSIFCGLSEWRDCASTGCPQVVGQQFRSCTGTWSAWSDCIATMGECDPSVHVREAEACGDCGEGVRYSFCGGAECSVLWSECVGGGCAPGTRTRSTEGCPPDEVRVSICGVDCAPIPGALCEPRSGPRDVTLLFDVSGSEEDALRAWKLALPEVVPDLLAEGAAVGVSYFCDYPIGTYGDPPDDVPFGGSLAPSTDAGAVRAAIEAVPLLSGQDPGEALVEALSILAGRAPHPTASPLACPPGRTPGGCWRPDGRAVIVIFTGDESHHDLPSMAVSVVPYGTDVDPPPPRWQDVRDALLAMDAYVVFVTDGIGHEGRPQMEAMVRELGQDPAASIVEHELDAPDAVARLVELLTEL